MTTAHPMSQRIESDLRNIAAEAEFLPELEAGLQEETDANRTVWHMEWRDLMDRLTRLDAAYRAGILTAAQREQYLRLIAQLRDHLPIMRRLGLPLPTVSLDVPASHAAD